MIASEVEEALSDMRWFTKKLEEMYQTKVICPHVQVRVSLLELIRALAVNENKDSNNPIVFSKGATTIFATFGDFNLTLSAEVD